VTHAPARRSYLWASSEVKCGEVIAE